MSRQEATFAMLIIPETNGHHAAAPEPALSAECVAA